MRDEEKTLVRFLFGVASLFTASAFAAEDWSTRPVRMIVPYAVGGSTDTVARLFAPALAERLGQQIVVDNRPGGSANIGMELVAKAPPDGYTIGIANIALGANATLFPKLAFDAQKDLVPVSLTVVLPVVLAVNPGLGVKSVPEFIALAKSKPGALNYSSAGNGSATHLACELFKYMTGTNIVHVAYKGGGPAILALLAGEVSMSMSSIPPALPHVKSGRLVALGVSGAKRNAALPDVPTVAEAGVPGFEVNEWQGIVVPRGTPPAIVRRLHKETVAVLARQDLKDRLASGVGGEFVGSSPEELGKHIAKEIVTWGKIIKAAGIRAE